MFNSSIKRYPLVHASDGCTGQAVRMCAQSLDLTLSDLVQIINLRPTTPVEAHVVRVSPCQSLPFVLLPSGVLPAVLAV